MSSNLTLTFPHVKNLADPPPEIGTNRKLVDDSDGTLTRVGIYNIPSGPEYPAVPGAESVVVYSRKGLQLILVVLIVYVCRRF